MSINSSVVRPRMKSKHKPEDFVWCICSREKSSGYKNIGNQTWVHSVCEKPAKLFWINVMLIEKYWKELDEIISRIIERQELEDGLDKGRAETACLFIATLNRPHDPDIKQIRDQAVERYKRRHAATRS